jgi:NADH dehydrogenase [ubiquinone] 1 alpha subcomplex assembly factor 7
MNPVEAELHRLIQVKGAVTIAEFMHCALAGRHGYYRGTDPFAATNAAASPDKPANVAEIGQAVQAASAAGDFVTAPEISQMFGELIGLWAVDTWQRLGAPDPFNLVELGPGSGLMMKDALRAARVAPDFLKAKRLHLVEIGDKLRQRQQAALADHAPCWHAGIETIERLPEIVLANEFLDALPIHQLVMTERGWMERVVTVNERGALSFGLQKSGVALAGLRAGHGLAQPGDIAEIGLAPQARMREVAARILQSGGAALFIDYGPGASGLGDSLQAVKAHRTLSPLALPGMADLTAHVDFAALADIARQAGALVFGPSTQGDFLRALGLDLRTEMLAAKSDPATAAILRRQRDRLIDPKQMGTLFKVLAVTGPGTRQLAGW